MLYRRSWIAVLFLFASAACSDNPSARLTWTSRNPRRI